MFRNPSEDIDQLGLVTINCMLSDGGLGDMIANTIAVDYLRRTYPHVNLLVWVPDYFLDFARNVLPDLSVRDFTTAKQKYDRSRPSVTTRWNGRHSGMKSHLVDYAFHMLCDRDVDITEKNYLKVKLDNIKIGRLKLPDKPFVVITTGYTAPNREFLPEHINKITAFARNKGYEIVFIGKKQAHTGLTHTIKGNFSTEIDYTGVNLIDKTNLLEAAKVISLSKCIIGLDNGLLHVAGCTDVAIVGGFTNVDPKARMPVRNNQLGWNYYPVTPPAELGCRFCQSNMSFLYGHDFKECYYKDYSCLKLLSAERYLQELEKIL